jgi:hypothetical protein
MPFAAPFAKALRGRQIVIIARQHGVRTSSKIALTRQPRRAPIALSARHISQATASHLFWIDSISTLLSMLTK